MKLVEAYMAWRPASHGDPGAVLVGTKDRVLVEYESERMTSWNGLCAGAPNDPMAQLAMMFINFNALTVRDGLQASDVHAAFLAVDEYRARIAPDIPGAE